jgi:signal transduction histidine kinase
VAAHLLERDPGQAYDALRNIKHTSGAALTDLRSTLDVLRDPSAAAPLGPPAGLGDIAELTGGLRSAGVTVTLDVDSAVDVPAAVQSVAYRIVQEALTNVARHAGASRATVSVHRSPGAIAVDVTDDGAATPDALTAETPGNGVRGMTERAAALGGTLEAGRADGGGWRVQALLPISVPAATGAPVVAAEPNGGGLWRCPPSSSSMTRRWCARAFTRCSTPRTTSPSSPRPRMGRAPWPRRASTGPRWC